MSILKVREIHSRSDIKKFIRFPYSLYKNTKQWVPPLIIDEMHTFNRKKNPAFKYCDTKFLLVYKNGKIAGRAAGIINHRYIEIWKKKCVRFGWIDFIDDEEVSALLINTLILWAKEKRMEYIHGPLGFTDMDHEGTLIEGFEETGTTATIYNHGYYRSHFEKLGFEKEADWVEFEIKVPDKIPEKAVRIAEIIKQKYKLKKVEAKSAKDYLKYGTDLFETLNAAYKNLFGFVPLNKEQIDLYIKQYFGFILPDFLILIVDEFDKVAGFAITMPSITKALQKSKGKLFPFGFYHLLKAMKKNNRYLDLYLGAIRPDLQGKGADALLMTELTRSCIKNNIISAESNIELETNTLIQAHWKYFDVRQHKRRRCFIKKI